MNAPSFPPLNSIVIFKSSAAAKYPSLRGKGGKKATVKQHCRFGQRPAIIIQFPGMPSLTKVYLDEVTCSSDVPTAKEAAHQESTALPGVEKERKDEEHDAQTALFNKIRDAGDKDRWWRGVFAVPNGTRTWRSVANRMKAEGTEEGVPDICCADARGGWLGLWIEMKAPGAYPRKEQKEWLRRLQRRGHLIRVCRSAEEAWTLLTYYRLLRPTAVARARHTAQGRYSSKGLPERSGSPLSEKRGAIRYRKRAR